jgi:hypothetical protein
MKQVEPSTGWAFYIVSEWHLIRSWFL